MLKSLSLSLVMGILLTHCAHGASRQRTRVVLKTAGPTISKCDRVAYEAPKVQHRAYREGCVHVTYPIGTDFDKTYSDCCAFEIRETGSNIVFIEVSGGLNIINNTSIVIENETLIISLLPGTDNTDERLEAILYIPRGTRGWYDHRGSICVDLFPLS